MASKVLPESCRIFVGFGAGPEEEMWQTFVAGTGDPTVRLDETRPETFFTYYCPRLGCLWKQVWRESGAVIAFLATTDLEPVASYRKDAITFAAMRMALYLLYRSWWTEHKDRGIIDVVFLAADTPAYACVDTAVAPVEYRQHGLNRRTILLPAFPRLKLLTAVEAEWYSRCMPQVKSSTLPCRVSVSQHELVLLIASVYTAPGFNKANDLGRLKDLIKWAERNGFRVIVRKHPREEDDFWSRHFPNVTIDPGGDRFEDALSRLRPMFVASWFSTSLVDALLANVVPVSIMQATDSWINDMVFEIPEHCLLWPIGESVMNALVKGETDVDSVVSGLLEAKPKYS